MIGVLCSLDLRDIKVVTKLGGTVDDSEMVDGMVFDHKAAKSAGGPTKIENAKIGLVQFQISPPKTDLENNVIISDYQQMDRILKEERNYILQMIKKIRATGCNVLLIQKSILRDAVTELSLHYLVRHCQHKLLLDSHVLACDYLAGNSTSLARRLCACVWMSPEQQQQLCQALRCCF